MATTETDLLENDPVLLSLIKTFSRSLPAPSRSLRTELNDDWSRPFALAGFRRFELRERYQIDEFTNTLVWLVRVKDRERPRPKTVELRYAMNVAELGYVSSDTLRCQRRLRILAEAHLRAHLHMLECGLVLSTSNEITFLDDRGRACNSEA